MFVVLDFYWMKTFFHDISVLIFLVSKFSNVKNQDYYEGVLPDTIRKTETIKCNFLTNLNFPITAGFDVLASSRPLIFCMHRPLAICSGVFPENAGSLGFAPHLSSSSMSSTFSASTAW